MLDAADWSLGVSLRLGLGRGLFCASPAPGGQHRGPVGLGLVQEAVQGFLRVLLLQLSSYRIQFWINPGLNFGQ